MKQRFFWKAALVVAIASVVAASGDAIAQEAYPNRSVKIVVPYAPGGLPDTAARVVARKMEAIWKQPIVVENRAGASGGLAVGTLTAAPADGYTLLVTEGSIFYNSLIIKKISYDWRELIPAAQIARAPQFLAVHPKVPATTMQEFIAYARSMPGKINYGSAGVGSPHHLAMEAVKSALKLDMVHVPFKGSGEATPALIGGHIEALWVAYPSISGLIKEGKLRLLAVNSPERSAIAPDVPAMADFIPDFDTASIIGIFAKAGTPDSVLAKIAQVAIEATQDAEVKQRLFTVGIEAAGLSGKDYGAALARERERVGKLVEEAKIQVD